MKYCYKTVSNRDSHSNSYSTSDCTYFASLVWCDNTLKQSYFQNQGAYCHSYYHGIFTNNYIVKYAGINIAFKNRMRL